MDTASHWHHVFFSCDPAGIGWIDFFICHFLFSASAFDRFSDFFVRKLRKYSVISFPMVSHIHLLLCEVQTFKDEWFVASH
jgi:hypothetical protein